MAQLLPAEARSIGFNESVTVGGRVLHVQTEILGRNEITIRTTIIDGGTVQLAESHACNPDATHLEQLRALAQEQHDRQVRKLTETG